MSGRHRVPQSLQSLFRDPPQESLSVFVSTLECSGNWLITQAIANLLKDVQDPLNTVLLASFLRDEASWTADLRRSHGIDIAKMNGQGHFKFIDCFTTLLGLKSSSSILETAEKAISTAIEEVPARQDSSRVILIIDSPDVLLAIGAATSMRLSQMIAMHRHLVHATFLAVCGDWPLIGAATAGHAQITALEKENATFVLQQAHLARSIISVRQMETGAAKDVSGVLRMTRGSDVYGWREEDVGAFDDLTEMESLYLMQRDGRVTMFARGTHE